LVLPFGLTRYYRDKKVVGVAHDVFVRLR
jgi:hypothetical protein